MIQFSVWSEPWPKDGFKFLTSFECPFAFYHLYEPYLLIRIAAEQEHDEILTGAQMLAYSMGLAYELGDKAKSSPSGHNEKYFYGEKEFYGEKLDRANTEWLLATSRLMRVLETEHKRNFRFLRKHLHLYCNQAGMNYPKEAWFLFRCAVKSFYLFLRYRFR